MSRTEAPVNHVVGPEWGSRRSAHKDGTAYLAATLTSGADICEITS
jgi:hypothetical protein